MERCYQDALPTLKAAYDAGDKYRIGVYVTLKATPNGGPNDIDNYLEVIKNLVKDFHTRESFIGIDTLDSANLDDTLCKNYWQRAYDLIRSYSPNCLIFFSDRNR